MQKLWLLEVTVSLTLTAFENGRVNKTAVKVVKSFSLTQLHNVGLPSHYKMKLTVTMLCVEQSAIVNYNAALLDTASTYLVNAWGPTSWICPTSPDMVAPCMRLVKVHPLLLQCVVCIQICKSKL